MFPSSIALPKSTIFSIVNVNRGKILLENTTISRDTGKIQAKNWPKILVVNTAGKILLQIYVQNVRKRHSKQSTNKIESAVKAMQTGVNRISSKSNANGSKSEMSNDPMML